MPRLFFAIPLPETVEYHLQDLETPLPEARWTFGVGLHLTLAFLGDCSKKELHKACDIAEQVHWSEFELSFDGAGVFPLRGRPKVLWLGTKKNETLVTLQSELSKNLRAASFDIEKRKFHPHVTLARVGRSPESAVHDWLARFVSYSSAPFPVRRFCLYESVLRKSGPQYSVVQSFECDD